MINLFVYSRAFEIELAERVAEDGQISYYVGPGSLDKYLSKMRRPSEDKYFKTNDQPYQCAAYSPFATGI